VSRAAIRGRAILPLGLLVLAWLVCTAVNVTKAVHIDDAAHLEIAEHILEDPFHPMSGSVFWGDAPAPIHELNQPHLLFYLLAGSLGASGGSLFAAHLLIAFFSALCAFFAFRLGRAIGLDDGSAAWGAALLLMGPAFIPSQNLMTDVPVLALWLAALSSLARADSDSGGRAWLAALYIGVACLIKYTSLVLLAVLVLDAFGRGRRRRLWSLIVPLGLLAAWSAFNVFDYGGVHLFGRSVGSARVGGVLATVGVIFGKAGLFVMTLGAVAPFTSGALPATLRRRGPRRVLAIVVGWLSFFLLVGQGLAAFGPVEMRGEPIVMSLLRGLFALNGLYAILLMRDAHRRLHDRGSRVAGTMLASWVAVTALFVIVLSPFVAVRHVLLVLPAVIVMLMASGVMPRSRGAFALTATLGLLVAVGDYRCADVYRKVTSSLADVGSERGGQVHFVGHWGFQHYAKAAGSSPYVPNETVLSTCDVIIRPTIVHQQAIDEGDRARLTLVEERTIAATLLDIPRTMTTRLGYYSVWHGLPYTFTLEPVESFEIYEVDADECASSSAFATAPRQGGIGPRIASARETSSTL